MGGSRIKQKDWVLTRGALDKFLYWLDADPDRAGHRYNIIHRKLCVFFAARDAGSLADETINRVARQIDDGRQITVKPETYVYAVAKNVLREYHDQPDQKKRALSDDPAIAGILKVDPWKNESDDVAEEKRIESLVQCLQKLDPRDREVFMRYYEKERKKGEAKKNREKLARELGIDKTKLRKQVMNIKAGLRACVDGYVERPGGE